MTEVEIEKIQKEWGNGIVKIGREYSKNGYQAAKSEAKKFIFEYYDYDHDQEKNKVLFKPTLASKSPFRMSFKGTLSYFVGGNINYPEDTGFALKPYINVVWDNKKTLIINDISAVAMGHYYFYDTQNKFTKVEYTFVYVMKGEKLKIISQHSSLPYEPKK